MLNALRRLHPFTHLALAAFVLLFVWLNLEFSRVLYTEKELYGWRGGMRCGYPCVFLDSGSHYYKRNPQGKEVLMVRHYTEGIPLGILANVLCLAGAGLLIGLLSQRAVRLLRTTPTGQAPPKTLHAIHGATYAVALVMAIGAVWLNMQVSTTQIDIPGGTDFRQEMGFPLAVYTASDPKLDRYKHLSSGEILAKLREHPDWWYRKARWSRRHIALNMLFAVTVVCAAAFCSERFFLRRSLLLVNSQPPIQPTP